MKECSRGCREFGISYANYLHYRLPFEQRNQLVIKFKR